MNFLTYFFVLIYKIEMKMQYVTYLLLLDYRVQAVAKYSSSQRNVNSYKNIVFE